MLLFKKNKIRKYAGGGSVGFASDFKVNIAEPQTAQITPQNMMNKYKRTKAKEPKPKEYKRGKLKANTEGMTEGARTTMDAFINGTINQLYELDPSDSQYGKVFSLTQAKTSGLQVQYKKDYDEYKGALGKASKANSLDDIAIYNERAFVEVTGKDGRKDIKAVPYDTLFKKGSGVTIKNALTVQDLADIKNHATDSHFSSAFVGHAINNQLPITRVIGNLQGTDALSKYISQQAKAGGKISTGKNMTLNIDGSDLDPELLKAFWQSGKIPPMKEENMTALNSAFTQIKSAIEDNDQLRDSMYSMILKRIPDSNEYDTSTQSGQIALREKVEQEKNRIIIEQLAKNLKVKLAGVTGSEDMSVGLDSGIDGAAGVSDKIIAMDPSMVNTETVSLGELRIDKENTKADYDGQVIKTTNARLDGDIASEVAKKQEKNPDAVAVSIAESQVLKNHIGSKLYTMDGQPLDSNVKQSLFINPNESIRIVPKMITKNGAPAVGVMKSIEDWFSSDAVTAAFTKEKEDLAKRPGGMTNEDQVELFNDYMQRGFHQLGFDDGQYKVEMMVMIPVGFTNDDEKLTDKDAQTLESSTYFGEVDKGHFLDESDMDSASDIDGFFKGWVMAKSISEATKRGMENKVYLPKSQLGPQSSRKTKNIFDHQVRASDLFTNETIDKLIRKK